MAIKSVFGALMIIPVALVINVFMEILPIETFIQSKYIWLDENKMNTKDGIVAGSYPTFMPRISATYGPENFPLVLKEVGEPFSTEEFLDWLKENLGEVERFLSIHGAVLFRGFSQALNTARSFERASLILEPNLEDEYLGTSPRTLVEGCKFVHTASEFPGWRIIPAHCEMSFLPNPPNRIFFYAHHPNEGDGGETPLVDYRQVLRDMDPEVLNRFKTKKIRYIRHYYDETDEFPASLDPFTTKSWQSMFYTHDTEVVKQKCKDQGFVATWTKQTEDGTPYGTLKLDHVMDATRINPKTGDEIWHNHMNVLHITAHTAEHAFSAQYLRSWEQLAYHYAFEAYVVVMRFWLGDERLGQQTTHEGAEPMLESDVDHMRQMTWKNTRLEKHQKGDLVMLDNYRVAHARQPYSGDRSILTTWAQLTLANSFLSILKSNSNNIIHYFKMGNIDMKEYISGNIDLEKVGFINQKQFEFMFKILEITAGFRQYLQDVNDPVIDTVFQEIKWRTISVDQAAEFFERVNKLYKQRILDLKKSRVDPLDETWEQPLLKWDSNTCHECYKSATSEFVAVAHEQGTYESQRVLPSIRTIPALKPGKKYYVEVVSSGYSKKAKVGITQDQEFPKNKQKWFSDNELGWSYYVQNGSTFHNGYDAFDGHKYPYKDEDISDSVVASFFDDLSQDDEHIKYKLGTTMGIYVDLIDGTLSYKFNGQYLGMAFEIPRNKEYYIAFAAHFGI